MYALFIGKTDTGVTVRKDQRWPGMWFVQLAGRTSDIVNLSRAKDAALSWARAAGFTVDANHAPHWHIMSE